MMSSRTSAQPAGHPFGHSIINNLNDVNFHFEFPKFGTLPGPTPPPSASSAKSPQRSTSLPSQVPERKDSGRTASAENRTEGVSPATSSHAQKSADGQLKDDLSKFSGVFSPPLTGATVSNASRSSVNVGQYSNGATSTSSPSASSNSNSNMGPSSSCGTSPEPFTQSPMGFKPVDTMTPIGEEQTTLVNATQCMC